MKTLYNDFNEQFTVVSFSFKGEKTKYQNLENLYI